MYEGRFTGFRPPDVPVEELGLLMAGIDGAGTPGQPEAPGLDAEPAAAPETSSNAPETPDARTEPPEAEAK
jgi:hypothetical protein